MKTPFEGWLNGTQPLPNRFYLGQVSDLVKGEWFCWVTPMVRAPLYLANTIAWLSLEESRKKTTAFLGKAAKIVQGLEGGWLDGWEREEMKASDLTAPPLCFPIYLITCEDDVSEKVVYVGLTSSSNRFVGGHAAALKLHDPRFATQNKWVYQCSVCFSIEDEYIFLEWVDPPETAIAILEDVESQLIHEIQPELNVAKRKTFAAKLPLCIQVQEWLPESRLKGLWIYPPAVMPSQGTPDPTKPVESIQCSADTVKSKVVQDAQGNP